MDSQRPRGGPEKASAPKKKGSRPRRGALRQPIPALVAAARKGTRGAFQELLGAYGPRLYGYFFRATGSHHDAEDLLGELVLRLVRHLPGYDDRGRFERWRSPLAAKVVRAGCGRAGATPPGGSRAAQRDGGATLAESVPGQSEAVDAGLVRAERRAVLFAALESLDEQSRQMVLLRHFGQLSFKEIAEIFDCPIGTVLAKVHRALKALRVILEGNDETH